MFSPKPQSGRVLQAYSIYDVKAETYNTPFFFRTHGEATRAFTQLSNDPQSQIAAHPEDYNLFHIGTFDPDVACLQSSKAPFSLGNALEFQTRKHNPGNPGKPVIEPQWGEHETHPNHG